MSAVQPSGILMDDDDDDLRGLADDETIGAGKDVGFIRRWRARVPVHARGDSPFTNKSIQQRAKVGGSAVSRARSLEPTGPGADEVFRLARAVWIAPPKRFLDDKQFELIEGLERLREAAWLHYGGDGKRIDGEAQVLLNRFHDELEQLLRKLVPPLAEADSSQE